VAANLAAGLPAFAEIPVGAADQIVGAPSTPGASSATVALAGPPTASVGLPGASSGSGGPGGTGGSNTRPSPPNGQGVAQANGSSDPGTVDTASALRTAGASCSEDSGSNNTGLDRAASNTTAAVPNATATATTPTAVAAKKNTSDTGEQQNASCPPAASAGAGTQ
jgi:hypothetical protein